MAAPSKAITLIHPESGKQSCDIGSRNERNLNRLRIPLPNLDSDSIALDLFYEFRVGPRSVRDALKRVERVLARPDGFLHDERAGLIQSPQMSIVAPQLGNWLTAEQRKRLLAGADGESLRGTRNYAILAVPIGCDLRRGELLGLRVDPIQSREERWVVADPVG